MYELYTRYPEGNHFAFHHWGCCVEIIFEWIEEVNLGLEEIYVAESGNKEIGKFHSRAVKPNNVSFLRLVLMSQITTDYKFWERVYHRTITLSSKDVQKDWTATQLSHFTHSLLHQNSHIILYTPIRLFQQLAWPDLLVFDSLDRAIRVSSRSIHFDTPFSVQQLNTLKLSNSP